MSSKHWVQKAKGALDKCRKSSGRTISDRHLSIAEHFAEKALDTAKTGKEYKAVDRLLNEISTVKAT